MQVFVERALSISNACYRAGSSAVYYLACFAKILNEIEYYSLSTYSNVDSREHLRLLVTSVYRQMVAVYIQYM